MAVDDWSAIQGVHSSPTISDRQLLNTSEDYCPLLETIVRQSLNYRRLIKDNLRPPPTSSVGKKYLVLPCKPAADQMVIETTKDRHRPSEDRRQPLIGLVRTTKDRRQFRGHC